MRGVWCVFLVSTLIAGCARKADLVIQGGSVWTGLSTGRGRPGAVAIADGKILAVGDSAEIARYIGSKTQVLRANGGLVMPGLADGHTHFIDGGFQLASIDLRNAATPQEFIRRLKEYASGRKPGEWITGGDWDHTLWRGAPLPQHGWIDSVTPNNPVFVNRLDGHEALANSAAMRAAGVSRSTASPEGGEVLRDARGDPPASSRMPRWLIWRRAGAVAGAARFRARAGARPRRCPRRDRDRAYVGVICRSRELSPVRARGPPNAPRRGISAAGELEDGCGERRPQCG